MVELGMSERIRGRVETARRRRFERLVQRALDDLPDNILAMLDNVDVVIEDEPEETLRADRQPADEELFGLYQGVPQTERDAGYSMVLPDKITLYRGPLERSCGSPAELAREVRVTVVHELGHHFGLDEDRLGELGWA